jgi:hypothetical protein
LVPFRRDKLRNKPRRERSNRGKKRIRPG